MELVRQAAAGDDHAFRVLVRKVYPKLRRWALARTGDPDAADEAVQQTLIRMHRGLARFSGDSALTTWLYRILTNVTIDLHRADTRRPAGQEEPVEEAAAHQSDPVRAIHAGRMAAAVRDYFETLPPRQREVLELVDFEGMPPVEVADLLGLKAVSVRASLFKARRSLRERILERFPELTEGYYA